MGRQSRQKQHLKQLHASAKHAARAEDDKSLEEVLESSSDDDEVLWTDEELDKQPSDAFKNFFMEVKICKLLSVHSVIMETV